MTRHCLLLLTIAGLVFGAEKKVQMKDLPPDVQKTVQEQTKGATIKALIKETTKGKTTYEVESVVNGKTRDFIVDEKGTVVEVEEQTSLDKIPAAAKAAIEKTIAGGKLGMVETFTKGGQTSYEAAYTTKSGKKASINVKADGTTVKD